MHKWIFIPRRISSETYSDVLDEKKGSNKIAIVNEDFTMAKIVEIPFKTLYPLHGFSTIAFVPGTNERHVLAIRTVEENYRSMVGDEHELTINSANSLKQFTKLAVEQSSH